MENPQRVPAQAHRGCHSVRAEVEKLTQLNVAIVFQERVLGHHQQMVRTP
jgi:hypothetical protein